MEEWRRVEVKGPGRSPGVVRMALAFMYGETIQGQVADYAALLDLAELLAMEDFRVEVEGHMVRHQAITLSNCRRLCWLANRYRLAGMAERCARYLADRHGGIFGLCLEASGTGHLQHTLLLPARLQDSCRDPSART